MLAHNVETVPRIFKRIRPGFRYERSLEVITAARAVELVTKSNLILGMGETREEVSEALRDLHEAGCELITITQYLRPSPRHHPVERWVKPQEFVELQQEAEEIGFAGRHVRAAGPLLLPRRPPVPAGAGAPQRDHRLTRARPVGALPCGRRCPVGSTAPWGRSARMCAKAHVEASSGFDPAVTDR